MFRIAVCDDDRSECLLAESFARAFFEKKEIPAQIDMYSAMPDLLSSGKSYDLYLLDVLMPGKSGIEGAADLQKLKDDPVIVFITSSLDSAIEGYQVNAAGFLLKPVLQDKFDETLERVFEQHLRDKTAVLSLIHNRVPISIPVSQILFLESQLHQTYIYLANGRTLSFSQKLNWFEELLGGYPSFIRCHQSYLVNLSFVTDLDGASFLMENRNRIPISRSYYKQCKYAYYEHCLKPDR